MKYEYLTEKQKAYICNGCGAKSGFVRPPKKIFFKASCNHHDHGHWKGGSEWQRWKSNYKFLKTMLKDAVWGSNNFFVFFYNAVWAILYFIAVQLVSWKFWHYCKNPRKVEDYYWEKIFQIYKPEDFIPWEVYLFPNCKHL